MGACQAIINGLQKLLALRVCSIVTSSKITSAHMTTKLLGVDCFFIIKGLQKHSPSRRL